MALAFRVTVFRVLSWGLRALLGYVYDYYDCYCCSCFTVLYFLYFVICAIVIRILLRITIVSFVLATTSYHKEVGEETLSRDTYEDPTFQGLC